MHSRTATIAHHHKYCDSATDNIFYVSLVLCGLGGACAISPAALLAGSVAPMSGFFGGVGIGYATRKAAREQVQSLPYAPPKAGDGKTSDLTV
jgi:hypothetical protein